MTIIKTSKPLDKLVGVKPGDQVIRIINGVEVTFQFCACKTWFQKTRKDKESCGNRCAQKNSIAWQDRNEK